MKHAMRLQPYFALLERSPYCHLLLALLVAAFAEEAAYTPVDSSLHHLKMMNFSVQSNRIHHRCDIDVTAMNDICLPMLIISISCQEENSINRTSGCQFLSSLHTHSPAQKSHAAEFEGLLFIVCLISEHMSLNTEAARRKLKAVDSYQPYVRCISI